MGDSLLRTDKEITEIYNKYVNTVYRICLMMLKNISETEDATQTVFIKLMQCQNQFKSNDHLKAWLIVTSQNVCKDMFKNWWRSKRVDFDCVKEPTYRMEDSLHDVWEKVMKLPYKLKLPTYLFYYEGYTTEEISKMLNLNHSTVRTHLHAARKKLKLMLEEEVK